MPARAFGCHGCGECCRRVGAVLTALAAAPASVLGAAAAAFPYPVRDDGACSQLGADNACAVYATRPILCNVEAMYDLIAPEGVSKADWYALNAAHCPPPPEAE